MTEPELREAIDRCKAEGQIDGGLALLQAEQASQPGARHLLWLELELAQHGRDQPRVAELSTRLLASYPGAEAKTLDHLRRLRFGAVLQQAGAGADGALAALPARSDEERRWKLLQGVRLAQHRYRFSTARALALALDRLAPGSELLSHRREALELAERLALMEAELAQAQALRERIRELLRASGDPGERQRAGAEPLRQWRLEIGANPAALEALERLRELPDPAACQGIATNLGREPNATALAFALLLRLRRAGWIGLQAPLIPGPDAAPIPRRLWLLRRHGAMTPALEGCEQRWREHQPGWELEWLDHQAEAIGRNSRLPPLVREACACMNDPAVRSDLLRLALLWQHGGVSLDWNVRSQAPLDPLLAGGAELVLVQDAWGSLSLELIAASAGHPFVKEALERACRAVLEGQGYSRWDLSGACLLSGVFARQMAPALAAGGRLGGVRVLSVHELQAWLGLNLPLRAPAGTEETRSPGLFDQELRRAALARLSAA